MLRHLSQPSGPLEIPDDRGGLGGLRRRIFIALQARKLASLLLGRCVCLGLPRFSVMKSAPAGSRPPPLIIDHPPAKRARVSPLGAARHPRGQLPCVDPLGSASRPAAGVVTPPRGGLAVPAAKTGRWTKREDETLRAVVEADAAGAGARDWGALAARAFGGARSPSQCADRWEKVLKLGLVKGPWTPGEDEVVRRAVAAAAGGAPAGSLNWAAVAALLPGRLTKQVREHQPAWKSTSEPGARKLTRCVRTGYALSASARATSAFALRLAGVSGTSGNRSSVSPFRSLIHFR